MSAIEIVCFARPERGKYLREGKYGFGIVDGSPAMRCCWTAGRFSNRNDVFHFKTQTEGFVFLAEGPNWIGSFRKDNTLSYLGLVPSLAVAGWRAATTKVKGMQAFALSYRNPEGHVGVFLASAPEDFVNQIAACLPPDKVKDDRKATEQA